MSNDGAESNAYVDPVDPVFELDVKPEDLVRVSESTAGDGYSAIEHLVQGQYGSMTFAPGVEVEDMAGMAQRTCELLLAKGRMTVFHILVCHGGNEDEAKKQLAELGVKAFLPDNEVSFPVERMPDEWLQKLVELGVRDMREKGQPPSES